MFAPNKRISVTGSSYTLGSSPDLRTRNKGAVKQARQESASFGTMNGYGGNQSTAYGPGPIATTSLLSGLVPEQETTLRTYYRDIYYHDVVAGAAVDIMSTFPFSEFQLIGGADASTLDKFEESVSRLNVRALLPQISLSYLVDAEFISTLVFSNKDKIFHDIIIHDPISCVSEDVPLFSTDPIIKVEGNPLLQKFLYNTDPQARRVKQLLSPELLRALQSSRFQLDPLSTLYVSRRTLPGAEPTSYLKRMLPIYLIERTLYRGTLVEATRRQRAMLHIIMGDDNWEPTAAEMMATVAQFQQADQDPLGAIVATRNGISVSEVRQGGDFWKWPDIAETFTPLKLRGLGISEAFLSGDSNFSNTETAMSVFMENMAAYRAFLTYKVFTNKIFPIIALANKFFKKGVNPSIGSTSEAMYLLNNQNDLIIPTLRWNKELKATDESNGFEMLDALAEKGVPIPLRMYAAAAKVDLDSLYLDLAQDGKIRENLSRATGKSEEEIVRDAQTRNTNDELSSLLSLTKRPKVPLLARDFGDLGLVAGETKTGKKKHIINQRAANDKVNSNIAKAVASLTKDKSRHQEVLASVKRVKGRVPNIIGFPE